MHVAHRLFAPALGNGSADGTDPAAARELGMFMQMQRRAVDGDEDLRFDPADELFELGAPWVTRNVHQMGAIGDDLYPLLDQQVDDPPDRFLVAGNSAGG